ncbi:MAG: hypothetical protein D6762_04090 [Candidatus Neomarinimicrobiota bacterium]|nr:MAG: hypothetical protein D6762_04090 [Candidatus Neomarinimicrobiota bacterium]
MHTFPTPGYPPGFQGISGENGPGLFAFRPGKAARFSRSQTRNPAIAGFRGDRAGRLGGGGPEMKFIS